MQHLKTPLLLTLVAVCACSSTNAPGTGRSETPKDADPTAAEQAPDDAAPRLPWVPDESTPRGWMKAGMNPKGYRMTTDQDVVHSGKASGVIAGLEKIEDGFGTLMQQFEPGELAGGRIQLTAYVRAEGVEDWGGVWMRVDRGQDVRAFDNMQKRPLIGSFDWKKVSIVLDVAEDADKIAFGILLDGPGKIWIDDIEIVGVSKRTPVTDMMATQNLPAGPQNLAFRD